jgi:hypothetical protein
VRSAIFMGRQNYVGQPPRDSNVRGAIFREIKIMRASPLGPRNRTYGPNDIETQEMEQSVGVNRMRQFFYNKQCEDVTRYDYGTLRAYWDTAVNPFSANWFGTPFQVGAWGPASAVNNGNGTVTFTLNNTAGAHSFFLHLVPDSPFPVGPMSNIHQTFQWTEAIQGGCGCK